MRKKTGRKRTLIDMMGQWSIMKEDEYTKAIAELLEKPPAMPL